MDEIQIIEKLGVAMSLELQNEINKSIQNIIKQLNNLEKRGEIKIIYFKDNHNRNVRLYLKNEIYNTIINT